uniref:SAB domain-containing protein n=1 Tax=Electrophorus electricus TaxID=8005 RepID=A0A4W4GYT5_ELEEL
MTVVIMFLFGFTTASLQSSQLWEQRRELEKNEWEERTSEESAEVVKIMKEAQYMRDGSEGLEVETRLKRADIAGESLEMVIVGKQPIMKSMEEKLEEQEDGARLQNVVIHQQRTQEVQRYDGQPQEVFTGRKIRKVEIVGGKQELLVGGQVVSEETIEGLEKKLLELESIEQRVQDTEGLKVRFREGEILEEKLRQAEQERALRRQQDDWHILMHHRHLAAGAKTEVALQTGGIQQWEEKTLQRPNPLPPIHTEDNWHVLLNLPPMSPQESWLTLSPSASLQSSQLWEQRQELEKNEWEERTSEESAEVVKIMKEAQYMRDGSEGLEVETRLKRADIAGESLEMVIVGKQPIMKSTEEKLEEQEDGARLQNVVIHQQRTQEVQRYDGQPQEVFTGRKIRKVEIVGGKQELLVGGQVVSEETIEGLEKKLLELESIEQRVQDTEGLKVRFREGEILEEKLRQAEQERAQRRQQDDWHILMHHRHLAAGAKTEVALQTGGIQQWEEKTLQRPNPLPPIHTEDNWHVLLNLPPRSPQESWLTLSPSASLQSSQLWEQRRELEKNEWEERTSEESAEVVKIMKEAQYMRDGSEGLEVETRLKRADIAGESLEMVIVGKQPIMKSTEEKLEEQEDGARLQNVVIHQQRTQEVQRYDGQPQDVFTGRKIRKVEIVGGKQELLVGGQVVSEETIEGLEKKLLELESIEQRVQDTEGLKVRFREGEILEEKLRQAEQERALRRQQDDWHILMHHRHLAAGAKTEVALQTGGIQQWEEKTLQRPNPLPPIHTEDNWHVLLNLPPRSPQESWLTLSPSASLQSSQLWEQRRELEKNEWEERTSEESAEVVKIMKEAQYMRDGSEGLEVETRLKRADIAGESLEMVIVGKQPIMKSTEEKLEEQEDGARLQNVVIHQQRTQEVQRYDGQPQDVFTGRKIRKVEIVGGKQELLVGGQVVSEETIEGLEKKLLELESIEQRVQDTEGLKVRFREGEILEEKLRQAEQERALRRQQDDWHILMHHRHLAAGAKTEVALQTGGIQQWEEKTLQRPNPLPPIHTEDNWHVLLNLPPRSPQESWLTLSPSASLQSSQLWEQRRELEKNEWEERTSEESAEVVKIMKEAQYMRDGSEGLEVETRLKRADIAGESLEMVIVGKQPIMKSTEEKLEEQEDGARLQNVVIHQQRTQEVQRYDGQPQEVFTGRKIRKVEIVGGKQELLVGGQVVSEETIEGLEKKLLELESIEERLQDIEGLKVRLLEVEILEEKLRQAEQERALRRQQDDWHILLYHRPLAAGAKTEVALQTGGIQQWEEKTLQRPNPLPPIHTEDNSHVLLNLPPRSPQESWLTLSLSDEEDRPVVPMVTESRQQEEERRWQDERKDSQVKEVLQVKESSQPPIAGQRASQLQREVNDDWFVQLNPSPKQSVPVAGVYEDTIDMRTPQIDTRVSEPVRMKGREVMIDVKPMIIEEKHLIIGEKHTIIRENPLKVGEVEKIPGALQEVDDSWFVLFDWTPFERRSVGTEVSDTWLSEERRTKEVQERKIREEERRKQEARALLQGEASNKWFVLLETPKGVKELDRRATEERVMEEELKKRVTEEERRKRAAVDERRAVQLPWEEKDDWFILLSVSPREPALKPPPVPVMSPVPVAVPKTHPLPPADQPLTSTPTARPAPITRPTYQEERTKMQDITQESIQDITQEETESSVLIRERKAKRIEGETIFIRHSILMLENFDETPEVVLRHHASIRELKRLFLEDVPVFGPTEWDKRLSTHTPVKIPKVTNGDLFLGMDLMADEILVT